MAGRSFWLRECAQLRARWVRGRAHGLEFGACLRVGGLLFNNGWCAGLKFDCGFKGVWFKNQILKFGGFTRG